MPFKIRICPRSINVRNNIFSASRKKMRKRSKSARKAKINQKTTVTKSSRLAQRKEIDAVEKHFNEMNVTVRRRRTTRR
jgi:hypothetical protein